MVRPTKARQGPGHGSDQAQIAPPLSPSLKCSLKPTATLSHSISGTLGFMFLARDQPSRTALGPGQSGVVPNGRRGKRARAPAAEKVAVLSATEARKRILQRTTRARQRPLRKRSKDVPLRSWRGASHRPVDQTRLFQVALSPPPRNHTRLYTNTQGATSRQKDTCECTGEKQTGERIAT